MTSKTKTIITQTVASFAIALSIFSIEPIINAFTLSKSTPLATISGIFKPKSSKPAKATNFWVEIVSENKTYICQESCFFQGWRDYTGQKVVITVGEDDLVIGIKFEDGKELTKQTILDLHLDKIKLTTIPATALWIFLLIQKILNRKSGE